MVLRRLEIAVIALTLAFVFFICGYFTGRSSNSVNVATMATQQVETQHAVALPELSSPDTPENPETAAAAAPVESAGQPTEIVGAPRSGDGRININTASKAELMDLPGIGNVLSDRIVEYRRQNGVFSRIEELRNVSGIGEKRFEAIRDRITV